MRLTTLSPFGQPRNTRELIVQLLAARPSLTLRQLRNGVRNLGRPMSSQALWKHLRCLMEDGQVERAAHGEYRINPAWVRDLRKLCDVLEANCEAGRAYAEAG